MFDNISFEIKNFKTVDFENLIEKWVLDTPRNLGNKYQVDWQNLRINYYPNESRIKVSNSFQKFFNAEISGLGMVNHEDFTIPQVRETIRYLSSAFNRNPKEMRLLGKFEYGLNISTGEYKPYNDIIERYQSIVTTATNPFNTFYNATGKPYSKFCSFTHYTIKCYDKGKQMGISGKNILRYEVVHHSAVKTKEVFDKESISLQDLTDLNIWSKCYAFIKKSYDHIRVLAFPSDGISNYVKSLCYSLGTLNKDYKDSLRNILEDLKICHDNIKNSPNSPHFIVRNGLVEKYNELIENETKTTSFSIYNIV